MTQYLINKFRLLEVLGLSLSLSRERVFLRGEQFSPLHSTCGQFLSIGDWLLCPYLATFSDFWQVCIPRLSFLFFCCFTSAYNVALETKNVSWENVFKIMESMYWCKVWRLWPFTPSCFVRRVILCFFVISKSVMPECWKEIFVVCLLFLSLCACVCVCVWSCVYICARCMWFRANLFLSFFSYFHLSFLPFFISFKIKSLFLYTHSLFTLYSRSIVIISSTYFFYLSTRERERENNQSAHFTCTSYLVNQRQGPP